MNTANFERWLARRTTRRLALSGALIGLSLPGLPTRTFAQTATPEQTPVNLLTKPSAQFGAYPFQLGVASGDPLPNSVILWTRLAPSPLSGGGMDPLPYDVRWELSTDDHFGIIVQSGIAVADPNLAHSVHVDVTGLEPGREYFYRFMVGSEVSQTGRTKTAPAMGQAVDAIRFGFASCANYEHGYFTAYRAMAAERLDLIVHLGDYIYEYQDGANNVRVPEERRVATGWEADALREYRDRFALYRTDADLRAAHESAPWVVTWDDHEVADNYAGDHDSGNAPVDAFLARRADAYQAYYEHMPLRPSSLPVGPDMTLFRHLSFGDLLHFYVLDTRQYRDPRPSGDGVRPRTPASLDPDVSMLGKEQERWLQQKLAESGAIWNTLAQQNFMAETYVPVAEGEAQTWYNDSWTGYPVARDRMLAQIREQQVSNPVVLTGDIHTAWANDLKADWENLASATIATEYVSTSISAGGATPSTSLQPYKDHFDYVKYFDGRHGGYIIAEVSADTWRSDYYVVDDLNDPASGVSMAATYVTEAGNPGAQPG